MSGRVVQLGAGRPRKPTALKSIKGTLRPDRVNAAEPQVAFSPLPPPPADLTEDERTAWVELAGLIDPMRVAGAPDVAAFRVMVQAVGMLATLRRSFREEGRGIPTYAEETKAGVQIRMRPEVYAIPTYQKLVLLHFSRWGLNPADRSRVSGLEDDSKTDNPLAKFSLGSRGTRR